MEGTSGLSDLRFRVADVFDPPPWKPEGRPPLLPHQIPPDGPWDLWLMLGGRGAGKTEGCARYFATHMRRHPGHRGRIIAPTFGDAVEACVQGPSGLMSMDPDIRFLPSAPGGAKVVWPNGSEALVLGTHSPNDVERLRAGGNRHIDWWEELAANRQLDKAWGQAQLGLRLGDRPHTIGSTTPRNRKMLRQLLDDPSTAVTRATTADNPHLTASFRAKLEQMYAGTRIGRQELGGELLDDVEGALWQRQRIDDLRVDTAPDLRRVVVAVDPAVTANEDSDETGIIVAGLGVDGHGYVLDDRSAILTADGWARRAVAAFDDWHADRLVAEVNQGGDLVEAAVRTVRHNVPYTAVRASRGKQVRAEPVAALYEQGRVHHVGSLPELEDQLTSWTPWDGQSPDRLDAAVWALSWLMGGCPGSRRS